jgi:hypothetical protein
MLQGTILGPLLCLVYINDIPKAIGNKAVPIIFVEDISILIKSPSNIQFQNYLNIVLGQLNKWFKANLLSLNFNKAYLIKFINKVHVLLTYKLRMKINKFIQILNNTLSWKTGNEYIKSKLSSA